MIQMLPGKEKPGNSDPLKDARVYYRHNQTGDRGFLVTREGREAIRRDRPAIDDYTFELKDWNKEAPETARYSDLQIAMVQFEADRKLCWAIGLADLSKREWVDMTEKQRLAWLKTGPASPTRAGLYKAIGEHLRGT
jgi:hypothetical protein